MQLRRLVLDAEKTVRVLKADVEKRTVTKLSVMPEGLEAALGRREFEDLIVYLASLK